jgi:hypothetical protein
VSCRRIAAQQSTCECVTVLFQQTVQESSEVQRVPATHNATNKRIPLDARPPKFETVFYLPNGSTVKPKYELYLASAKTQIPARAQIEGGLFISRKCESSVPNGDCVDKGLMRAEEALLTDTNTKVRYRIFVKGQ